MVSIPLRGEGRCNNSRTGAQFRVVLERRFQSPCGGRGVATCLTTSRPTISRKCRFNPLAGGGALKPPLIVGGWTGCGQEVSIPLRGEGRCNGCGSGMRTQITCRWRFNPLAGGGALQPGQRRTCWTTWQRLGFNPLAGGGALQLELSTPCLTARHSPRFQSPCGGRGVATLRMLGQALGHGWAWSGFNPLAGGGALQLR